MSQIKLGMGQMGEMNLSRLRFIKQLGINYINFNTPNLPGEQCWQFKDIVALKETCADMGLHLEAIENVPRKFYIKAMLGLPGRDQQIANYQKIIQAVGQAGIPVLGYNWMPSQVWRTTRAQPYRAGATVTAYDHELVKNSPPTHGREYTEQEMWDNYVYFLKAVLPVAEEAGVKLALHPDDPPVQSLGGIPRLFSSFAGLKKAMEVVPSEAHGLDFCQGTVAEMDEERDIYSIIRYFAERGKIIYVHFRDIAGTADSFHECFINEGKTDMFKAMKTYKEAGFSGMMITDHCPNLEGDTDWGERARAFSIGYMKALLEVVNGL